MKIWCYEIESGGNSSYIIMLPCCYDIAHSIIIIIQHAYAHMGEYGSMGECPCPQKIESYKTKILYTYCMGYSYTSLKNENALQVTTIHKSKSTELT